MPSSSQPVPQPVPQPSPQSSLEKMLAAQPTALSHAATQTPRPAQAAYTPPLLQPALVPPPSRADITQSGGETAQEIDQLLRRAVTSYRNALVEQAHYAYRLFEKDDWAATGFTSGDDYRASLGLSSSAWETYLVLGERLSHLSLSQMRELTVASAKLLTKIPWKLWEEFAWVEEARLLPPREFADLVGARLRQLNPKKGLAEPRTTLQIAVPTTQHTKFDVRIESLRRQHNLRSQGEVLDLALRAAERDPAIVAGVQRLEGKLAELQQLWGELANAERLETGRTEMDELAAPPTPLTQSQRVTLKIQRIVKEIGKYAHALQTEEPPSCQQPSPGADHSAT